MRPSRCSLPLFLEAHGIGQLLKGAVGLTLGKFLSLQGGWLDIE